MCESFAFLCYPTRAIDWALLVLKHGWYYCPESSLAFVRSFPTVFVKGTVASVFLSRFFHESTYHMPLMNVYEYFWILFCFCFVWLRYSYKIGNFLRIIFRKSELPRIIWQKGMPFPEIIRGNSKLSADYTSESFLFLKRVSSEMKQGLRLGKNWLRKSLLPGSILLKFKGTPSREEHKTSFSV